MAIREVLKLGNPKLREKSKDVVCFNKELEEVLEDLKDTLTYFQETHNIGRALASPQIGYLKRVVYCQLPGRQIVMINPEIVWKSAETFEVWDSCFSFNVAFFVKIKRHKSIKVSYMDEKGLRKTENYEDDLSELFQHEIDHLDGVLAIDHLTDCKNIIMREEWEKSYQIR